MRAVRCARLLQAAGSSSESVHTALARRASRAQELREKEEREKERMRKKWRELLVSAESASARVVRETSFLPAHSARSTKRQPVRAGFE